MRRRPPVASDRRLKRRLALDGRLEGTQERRADYGPAERWQHARRGFALTERAGMFAARVMEECLLDELLVRGLITGEQHAAGLRLRGDYLRARLAPKVTGGYSGLRQAHLRGGAVFERSVDAEAAYVRWRLAVRYLGLALSEAVITVCCAEAMVEAGRLDELSSGLQKLTQWYGLVAVTPRQNRARVTHQVSLESVRAGLMQPKKRSAQ